MEEINLYNLLKFYAKNWLLLISALMVGAVIGLIYTGFIQKPMYRSEASIVVTGLERSSTQDSVTLNNYINLFKSNKVLGPVAEKSDYEGGVRELRSNTTAENEKGSDFIRLSIATTEAKASKSILDGAIEEFKVQVRDLYGDNRVRINTINAPSTPSSPHNVNPAMQIGLGMTTVFALLVIVLFFIYDYKSSRQEVEDLETKDKEKAIEPELTTTETPTPEVAVAEIEPEEEPTPTKEATPKKEKSKKSKSNPKKKKNKQQNAA